MYEPLQYLAALVLLVLAIAVLVLITIFFAWVIRHFSLYPELRKKGICPRCNSAEVRLSTVGIFWKLYWFYPILLSPFLLLIALVFSIDITVALVIGYFIVSFLLLFFGLLWGVVPFLLGTMKYECPSCKEKYFYHGKKIVHPDDLPKVLAIESALGNRIVDSEEEGEDLAKATTSKDEDEIFREIAERKLAKGTTSTEQEEILRAMIARKTTEEK